MVVILLAGITVLAVATVAHLLDRSRRLRQRLRARTVALMAWTYRVRRATGHLLGRLTSQTN
jgi:prolyl-tRNA editing enzyme YbaK/EbsC (Cys-tRNA(Pro) deacylase)